MRKGSVDVKQRIRLRRGEKKQKEVKAKRRS